MTGRGRSDLPRCRSAEEALAWFDTLAPVSPAAVVGRWAGCTFPSGHPLDGVLESHGWLGKRIDGPEVVHPLVFRTWQDRPLHLDAARLLPWLPLLLRFPVLGSATAGRLLAPLRPLFATRRPGARLRPLWHRGCVSAAIVYDRVPVLDLLRAIDPDTLLGQMDLRGLPRPYFFLLLREPP